MGYHSLPNPLHVYLHKKHIKFQKYFSYRNATTNEPTCHIVQGEPKAEPPYQMQIFKGYKNVMIRRDFATFLIYHPVAKALEEYMHDVVIPDELIYATLSRIENIKEGNASLLILFTISTFSSLCL